MPFHFPLLAMLARIFYEFLFNLATAALKQVFDGEEFAMSDKEVTRFEPSKSVREATLHGQLFPQRLGYAVVSNA